MNLEERKRNEAILTFVEQLPKLFKREEINFNVDAVKLSSNGETYDSVQFTINNKRYNFQSSFKEQSNYFEFLDYISLKTFNSIKNISFKNNIDKHQLLEIISSTNSEFENKFYQLVGSLMFKNDDFDEELKNKYLLDYGSLVEDYKERIEVEKAMYEDPLTGLFNKRCWSLLVPVEKIIDGKKIIETGRRGEDIDNLNILFKREIIFQKSAVMFLDLNNFKAINDNYGHDKGDIVLQRVAELIKNIPDASGFRLGGDEFTLICDKDKITDIIKILREDLIKINKELNIADEFALSTSIGISIADFEKIDKSKKGYEKMSYRKLDTLKYSLNDADDYQHVDKMAGKILRGGVYNRNKEAYEEIKVNKEDIENIKKYKDYLESQNLYLPGVSDFEDLYKAKLIERYNKADVIEKRKIEKLAGMIDFKINTNVNTTQKGLKK